VEAHLFNPPSVSLAMSLGNIGEKAEYVWNRIKTAFSSQHWCGRDSCGRDLRYAIEVKMIPQYRVWILVYGQKNGFLIFMWTRMIGPLTYISTPMEQERRSPMWRIWILQRKNRNISRLMAWNNAGQVTVIWSLSMISALTNSLAWKLNLWTLVLFDYPRVALVIEKRQIMFGIYLNVCLIISYK
jgi:hypothetical protein